MCPTSLEMLNVWITKCGPWITGVDLTALTHSNLNDIQVCLPSVCRFRWCTFFHNEQVRVLHVWTCDKWKNWFDYFPNLEILYLTHWRVMEDLEDFLVCALKEGDCRSLHTLCVRTQAEPSDKVLEIIRESHLRKFAWVASEGGRVIKLPNIEVYNQLEYAEVGDIHDIISKCDRMMLVPTTKVLFYLIFQARNYSWYAAHGYIQLVKILSEDYQIRPSKIFTSGSLSVPGLTT